MFGIKPGCISFVLMKDNLNNYYGKIKDLFRHSLSEEHKLFARRYASKAKHYIDEGMKGMDQEAVETREMASSFFRMLEHKLNLNNRPDPPSKEEVKAAIQQLKDVGRFSFFVTAVILPGGVFSLIGLEMLAKKYGINFTIIPSAFRKKKKGDSGLPDRIE